MPSSPSSKSAHHVLLVDDNDGIRDALAEVLRAEGFTIAPARSVEDALRQLRQGFRPCVVLLDVKMPGLDGLALLNRIQPHVADVPVVIVSGHRAEAARARAYGCDSLFLPIDPGVLIEAIGQQCRRQRHGV